MDELHLLMWMLLLTVSTVPSGQYVIHVPAGNKANSNTLIQNYLCGNGSHLLQSDTVLVLSSSVPHYLVPGPFCLVKNITNITIASDNSVKVAHIVCHNDTTPTRGIGFINISGLYLYNLHIHQCGGILNIAAISNNTWLYFPIGLSAVLLFHHCNELHISNVSIDGGYYGYGVIAIDVYGETIFYNMTVTDSTVCSSQQLKLVSSFCSGSGLLFLFIDESDELQSRYLLIKKSTISRNVNQYLWGQTPIDDLQFGSQQVAVFGAGGLTIIFSGSLNNNEHVVLESNEVSSNSGNIADGCLVLYLNTISSTLPSLMFNTTSSIINFYNNSVTGTYRARGGGVAIYVIIGTIPTIKTRLTITFNHIKFFNNTNADYGGAVFIQIPRISHIFIKIYFYKTVWLFNEAEIGGSALYIQANNHISSIDDNYDNSVVFSDTWETSYGDTSFTPGHGFKTGSIFEFSHIRSVFVKQHDAGNIFEANSQSVLVLVNSSLFIQGKVIFYYNHARSGSSIRLESLSHVTFLAPAEINFHHDINFSPGGAITAIGQSYGGYTDCPVSLQTNNNITIYFDEGYAVGNYFLYSDGLDNCKFESFHPFKKLLSVISSPPTKLHQCHQNDSAHKIFTYPGKAVVLSVIAENLQKKATLTKMFVILEQSALSDSWTVNKKDQTTLLDDVTCTNVSFKLLCMMPPSRSVNNVYLTVHEGSIQLTLHVVMLPCPFGFSRIHGACVCDSFIITQKIASICNIDTTSITILLVSSHLLML